MSVSIVFFVGSAFLGADSELVGEVSADAVAVVGFGIEFGVDGAGDAVSVADEVVGGAFLAGSSQQSESFKAQTFSCFLVVG